MMLSTYSRAFLRIKKPGLRCWQQKISGVAPKRDFKEVEIKVPWGKIAGKLILTY